MKPSLLAPPVLALLFAGTTTAVRAQNIQFDYKELYSAHQELQAVADARYLRPGLRLSGKAFNRRDKPVVLTIKALQEDIELRVDPNGNFDLPATPQLRQENPQVWTNVNHTAGAMDVQTSLRVEAPARREFDYTLIGAMRDEFSRSRGLMSRFFSRNLRGVLIDFGANGQYQANVTVAGSTQVYSSDSDGYLRLPAGDQLIANRATVSLSAMPVAIRLEME